MGRVRREDLASTNDVQHPGAATHPPFLTDLYSMALSGASPTALSEATVAVLARELGLACVGIAELVPDHGLRILAAAGCVSGARGRLVPWDRARYLLDPLAKGVASWRDLLDLPECRQHRSSNQLVCLVGSSDPAGAILAFTPGDRIASVADRSVLDRIAATLAAAFTRNRLEDALRRAANESEILSEIARTIGSSLDIEDVYPRFARETGKLIVHDRVAIALLDLESRTATPTYVAGIDVPAWRLGIPRSIEGTSVSAVISGRTSIIVQDNNLEQFVRRFPLTDVGHDAGLRSLLSVPILWRDEIIGILSFRSARTDAFTQRDRVAGERVAASIANAVANARLHTEVKRHAYDQAVLAEIGRIVGSSLYVEEVFVRLAESIRKLVPFDHMAVTSLDRDLGTSRVVYANGDSIPDSEPGRDVPLSGTATEAAALGRAALLITPDAIRNTDGRLRSMRFGLDFGFQSAIAVPLLHRNDAVGALILRSKQASAYGLRELSAAERIGFQMAGAVATNALFGQLERLAREGAILADLGAVSVAVRELDTLFRLTHETIARLIAFDRIEFVINGPGPSSMTLGYAHGIRIQGHEPGTTVLANPRTDPWSARYGHLDRDVADLPGPGELLLDAGLRSWVRVPLRSRDCIVGSITLLGVNEGQYGDEELRILSRVGVQVGPVMHVVLASERAEDDARVWGVIGQLALTLGTVIDRTQLHERFAEQSRLLIPFDRLAINRVDLSRGTLEYVHVSGPVVGDRVPGSVVPLAGTVSELVAATKRPLVLRDGVPTEDNGSLRHNVTSRIAAHGFHSGLVFPLMIGGVSVGTVHFSSRAHDCYTQRHLELGNQISGLLTATFASSRLGIDEAVGPGQRSPAAGVEPHRALFAGMALRPEQRSLKAGDGENVPAGRTVRIVIVDSHTLCRDGLRGAFDSTPVEVAGEAASLLVGASIDPVPDVVLWELHPEDLDEIRILSELRGRCPALRVLILSGEGSVDLLRKALAGGASGFVLMGVSKDGLVGAVQEVASGGMVVDPGLLAELLGDLPTSQLGPSSQDVSLLAHLSDRDVYILRAIAGGKSNAGIARDLGYSEGTIKNRVTRIYRLIGVHGRAGVTKFAVKAGIVK